VPPTFGTPPSLVLGILAGGPDALARPREAAEDDPAAGAEEMRRSGVRTEDAVVGISASGRTPFVLGAVEEAGRRGALTIGLACDDPTPLAERVDIAIHPIVGPEVLAGSTRLKAGTAQKLVLDMLTTAVMTRLGRVHHNLMVGVRASNAKLIDRARRIVADVTGRPLAEAQAALADAEGSAAVAIVMLTRGLPADEARDLLATATLGELLDGMGGAVDA
jgi:N-acetylmuramic acid 6-phosphate etherase